MRGFRVRGGAPAVRSVLGGPLTPVQKVVTALFVLGFLGLVAAAVWRVIFSVMEMFLR